MPKAHFEGTTREAACVFALCTMVQAVTHDGIHEPIASGTKTGPTKGIPGHVEAGD